MAPPPARNESSDRPPLDFFGSSFPFRNRGCKREGRTHEGHSTAHTHTNKTREKTRPVPSADCAGPDQNTTHTDCLPAKNGTKMVYSASPPSLWLTPPSLLAPTKADHPSSVHAYSPSLLSCRGLLLLLPLFLLLCLRNSCVYGRVSHSACVNTSIDATYTDRYIYAPLFLPIDTYTDR